MSIRVKTDGLNEEEKQLFMVFVRAYETLVSAPADPSALAAVDQAEVQLEKQDLLVFYDFEDDCVTYIRY